ncbi:MAG: hypothetical protein Tsb0020_06650 [Haliangiales bacterium]
MIAHRRNSLSVVVAVGIALAAAPTSSWAQEAPSEHGVDVDFAVDGAVTAGLLLSTGLVTLIPVDTDQRWDNELFGDLDEGVKDNFSTSAAELSDMLITLTSLAPVLLQLPGGLNEETGRRLLLYSESVGASLFVNNVAKYVVQRPRPYTYNEDPRVQAYEVEQGKDAYLSFYSGHASTAFAAAVSGSYLFSLGGNEEPTKATVWFFQMALATATSNLRVRAGKHFYSDVLIGAIAGSAIGFAVPALHADDRGVRMPSGLEWGAIAGGILVGGVASQLLPLDSDILTPLDSDSRASVSVVPLAQAGVASIGFAGTF